MNLKERFYSESELRGREVNQEQERLYSSYEVNEISELFSDFYSEYSDEFNDVDEAYENFLDVYSTVSFKNKDEETSSNKKGELKTVPKKGLKLNKTQFVAGSTAVGAGAGLAASKLMTIKLKKEIKSIEQKMSKGLAKSSDIQKLDSLKKKLKRRKLISTVAGAGIAGGAAYLGHKHLKDTNNSSEEVFQDDTYPVLTTAAIVAGGAALGGAAGNIRARIKNRDLKRKIKRLQAKKSLNAFDQQRLNSLKKEYKSKLYRSTGKGAVIGGAAGLGGVAAGGTKAILAGAGAAKGAVVGAGKYLAAKAGLAGKGIAGLSSGLKGAGGAIAGTVAGSKIFNKFNKEKKQEQIKKLRDRRAGATAIGLGAGAATGLLATTRLRRELKTLKAKENKTSADLQRIESLKKKIRSTIVGGTATGGVVGYQVGKHNNNKAAKRASNS